MNEQKNSIAYFPFMKINIRRGAKNVHSRNMIVTVKMNLGFK